MLCWCHSPRTSSAMALHTCSSPLGSRRFGRRQPTCHMRCRPPTCRYTRCLLPDCRNSTLPRHRIDSHPRTSRSHCTCSQRRRPIQGNCCRRCTGSQFHCRRCRSYPFLELTSTCSFLDTYWWEIQTDCCRCSTLVHRPCRNWRLWRRGRAAVQNLRPAALCPQTVLHSSRTSRQTRDDLRPARSRHRGCGRAEWTAFEDLPYAYALACRASCAARRR